MAWTIRNPKTLEVIRVHESVTQDRVLALAESQMFDLDNPGVCLSCGEERDGCEPDARWYRCEACDRQHCSARPSC